MRTTGWMQSLLATVRRRNVQVGAAVAALGFAALASVASVAHGSGPADAPWTPHSRTLQIAFATPAPLTLPPAPSDADRLDVTADLSREAFVDPGLRDSLGLAQVAAMERREEAMRDRELATYEAQDRRLRAEMIAIMHPTPSIEAAAVTPQAEPETVAASGDTGPATRTGAPQSY